MVVAIAAEALTRKPVSVLAMVMERSTTEGVRLRCCGLRKILNCLGLGISDSGFTTSGLGCGFVSGRLRDWDLGLADEDFKSSGNPAKEIRRGVLGSDCRPQDPKP